MIDQPSEMQVCTGWFDCVAEERDVEGNDREWQEPKHGLRLCPSQAQPSCRPEGRQKMTRC